jgi:hypothetical protein
MQMKNISVLALSMALSAGAFAQTAEPMATDKKDEKVYSFKSINGHEVLPQCGDWSLGISATSFLNYIGNLANNSTFNPAPTFNSANAPAPFAIGNLSGVAVVGKYMKTADMAYRVRFQVNAGSFENRNMVRKNELTPDPLNPQYVEDNVTTNNYTVLLGAGIEKRRGNSRLQGIYGAEVIAGLAGSNSSYSYGNPFTIDFNTPITTTDFATSSSSAVSIRNKQSSTGTMWLVGVRGYVGVEYFIAPKISLGGEIGYTVGFSTNGKGYTTTEQWNSATNGTSVVTHDNFNNQGLRSWGIGLDNVNAGINFNFYF